MITLKKRQKMFDDWKSLKNKCNGDSQFDLKTFSKTFLFFSINVGLYGLLFAAIINCLVIYNRWPTYTKVTVVPQNEAKYPAITICPLLNGYKENILQVSIIPDLFICFNQGAN